MEITRNIAKWDKFGRLGLGALLIALAVFGVIGVWGYVGVILVATGFMNFCPLYRIVGFKTCTDC